MNRRTKNVDVTNSVTIDTLTLQAYTGTGRKSAINIGMAAGARVKIGKRVLWNTQKVRDYINSISAGDNGEQSTPKEVITR